MVARLRQQPQSRLAETNPPEFLLTDAPLPAAIIERLAANGIFTASDWQKLSRSRKASFWGITKSAVAQIDAAVKGIIS